MKTSSKMATMAVVAALWSCNTATSSTPGLAKQDDSTRIQELEAKVKAMEDQQASDERLGQWALNAMYLAGAQKKLSDTKKLMLAQDIVHVANDIFDNEPHRRAFVSIIAMESGFDRFAQSPTGPKGLAQVARKSFHEAMKEYCGMTDLHDEDVWETKINLYAGACYYRKMLELSKGDVDVANVMYNQGPNSDSVKTFIKYGSMEALEPMKYVIKFGHLQKKNDQDAPIPGAQVISELPKPSPK